MESPSDLFEAVYLGDGLFAVFDGWQIELYASNGVGEHDTGWFSDPGSDDFGHDIARSRPERDPDEAYEQMRDLQIEDEKEGSRG